MHLFRRGKLQTEGFQFIYQCPGCNERHGIPVNCPNGWTFDGNDAAPTISPSILCRGVRPITDDEIVILNGGGYVEPEPRVCHSFIRAGRIEFLGDCTHRLAGQTVDMVPLDLIAAGQ